LPFHEAIGHREVIARAYQVLAKALTRQGRAKEGLPYAQRAVEIFIMLRHRGIAEAQAVLKECEEAASDGLQPSE
jgi:hypothetical protein